MGYIVHSWFVCVDLCSETSYTVMISIKHRCSRYIFHAVLFAVCRIMCPLVYVRVAKTLSDSCSTLLVKTFASKFTLHTDLNVHLWNIFFLAFQESKGSVNRAFPGKCAKIPNLWLANSNDDGMFLYHDGCAVCHCLIISHKCCRASSLQTLWTASSLILASS